MYIATVEPEFEGIRTTVLDNTLPRYTGRLSLMLYSGNSELKHTLNPVPPTLSINLNSLLLPELLKIQRYYTGIFLRPTDPKIQMSKEITDRKIHITKFIFLICSLKNYCRRALLATFVFFLSPHLAFDTFTLICFWDFIIY